MHGPLHVYSCDRRLDARRLSWYACALIMLESTTPFGNFRYLMSKSDSPVTGKNSVLYTINAAAWVVSSQSSCLVCATRTGLTGGAVLLLLVAVVAGESRAEA